MNSLKLFKVDYSFYDEDNMQLDTSSIHVVGNDFIDIAEHYYKEFINNEYKRILSITEILDVSKLIDGV